MILCWLFTYRLGILHSGIMWPRFHDSSFIPDIWHSVFWNYVASIPCSLFHLRYLNSAFPIRELCCLDFMILVLFTTFAFCILELCCLDSMFLVSFTVFEFCIPHSGIMLPPFYVPFFFLRYVHSGIMLPRFHDH